MRVLLPLLALAALGIVLWSSRGVEPISEGDRLAAAPEPAPVAAAPSDTTRSALRTPLDESSITPAADPGSPSPVRDLRAEFLAAGSDGRRIEILFAMESAEDVLAAVRDESLITSPLISMAAVRLRQLWNGDDAEVLAAVDRIRGGVDPVERFVLLSALVIEHRFREMEGVGPAIVDVQDEVLGAYLAATEPEFRYRMVNACSTFSPSTAYLVLDDVRSRPRDAVPSHPELSTQVAAALALGQMLDLSKGAVIDPSVAEVWMRESDTVISMSRALIRDPGIDPLAFRHLVRALGRHRGIGELEHIREELQGGDPVLLEVLRKERELLEKGR